MLSEINIRSVNKASKHGCLWIWIAALFIFCVPHNSHAFKTRFGFGEPIHENILRDALTPLGFQEQSIDKIIEGCNSQDWPFSSKFTNSPHHHFDDNRIRDSYEYITHQLNIAKIAAANAVGNPKSRDRVLYMLGEALHALQDFYSHSNYVEWLLHDNKPLVPMDWKAGIPPGIRSGYYYFSWLLDNEMVRPRAGSVEGLLKELHTQHPEIRFHTDEEYKIRKNNPTYTNALDYVLADTEVLHCELNKDDKNSFQGSIVVPHATKAGNNFYEIARTLATDDTARHWKMFCEMLREEYGKGAPAIIAYLEGKP